MSSETMYVLQNAKNNQEYLAVGQKSHGDLHGHYCFLPYGDHTIKYNDQDAATARSDMENRKMGWTADDFLRVPDPGPSGGSKKSNK